MDEIEIKKLLDDLADYQVHRDLLESDKRTLLDQNEVPADVQAIVKAGSQRIAELYADSPDQAIIDAEEKAALDAIVVPEEIKAQLAAIDELRKAAKNKAEEARAAIRAGIEAKKNAIQAEIEQQTAGVYTALTQRKAEIEAEFSGKAEAVDENIKKLTEEIKAEVKAIGYTVKSDHFQAVYTKAKKTWIPQRLEAYTEHHPDIKDCYTVGDPSVALKRI